MAWVFRFCVFLAVHCIVSSLPITLQSVPEDNSTGDGSDEPLFNVELFQGDIYRRDQSRMDITWKLRTWPNGVIIYKLDEKIGCPESPQCALLARAFNHYHTHTCVRFQEWTGEEDYVFIEYYKENRNGCGSEVGFNGGMQRLSLGRRCWYQGIIIHELGHSVGLWHEMNRPDRDQYINVTWDNIQPDFVPQFAKLDPSLYINLEQDFDLKSIMMYDEFAFSKNISTLPTIVTKDDSVIGPIWRKSGLSSTDIRRINQLYNCPKDQTSSRASSDRSNDIECTFDKHTCGFKSAGTIPWRWHQVNKTEGYVYNSRKALPSRTDGNTGYFVSVNFYGISSEKAKISPMGCVRFWYLVQGDQKSYLKLRQSYLSHPTQLAIVPEDTFDLWESANAADTWTYAQVPLYVTSPFKLIFESSPGDGQTGLVALDDLHISFSPCSSKNIQDTMKK